MTVFVGMIVGLFQTKAVVYKSASTKVLEVLPDLTLVVAYFGDLKH